MIKIVAYVHLMSPSIIYAIDTETKEILEEENIYATNTAAILAFIERHNSSDKIVLIGAEEYVNHIKDRVNELSLRNYNKQYTFEIRPVENAYLKLDK